MMQAMPKVPAPRAYLDGLDPDLEATGHHYADMLEAKILEEGPESVLAFIVEPIGGASTGALVPPRGYMERVQEICRKYGVLLILDEVMTGAGRTGVPRLRALGSRAGYHRDVQGLRRRIRAARRDGGA